MYWVVESINDEMRITKSITENEFSELKKFSKSIEKIRGQSEYCDFLKEEFQEYLLVIENKKSKATNITRAINNYLSSYKAFLDRWETYFKREGNELFIQHFKKTVSDVYDKCFEYRFLYNLRNYAQHAGIPISKINSSLTDETEILISKEIFLNSHSGMQPKFRKELKCVQIEEIDVDNAIKKVHVELENVHKSFVDIIIHSTEDVLLSSVFIKNFYDKYSKYNGELTIISQENVDDIVAMSKKPGTATINPYSVDYLLAVNILKGARIKFKYKGKLGRKKEGFPRLSYSENILEMPTIHPGSKKANYKGILWTWIFDITGFEWQDGYDRLFTVYMPAGLDMDIYKEVAGSYDKEKDEFFERL